MSHLDDRLLEALPAEDRAAIARWCDRLGIGPDGWRLVPGFLSLVELLAILTTADGLRAEDPGISESAAFYKAAEGLGFEDDPACATHPAGTPARRLRDWLSRAWPESGENLQSRRSA